MNIYPSYILITRNTNDEDNASPGYWNHCAIYIGNNQIVEAQQDYNQVVVSDLSEFWSRYSEILLIQMTNSTATARKMVTQAKALIGVKYRRLASMFRYMRNEKMGENCVTVVRKCYLAGFNIDPRWHRPDHVVKYGKIVYQK